MPTKVTVIGEEKNNKKDVPIDLLHCLNSYNDDTDQYYTSYAGVSGKAFDCVELISRNYLKGFDLIFAYNKNRNDGSEACLFLGYWNDGVV